MTVPEKNFFDSKKLKKKSHWLTRWSLTRYSLTLMEDYSMYSSSWVSKDDCVTEGSIVDVAGAAAGVCWTGGNACLEAQNKAVVGDRKVDKGDPPVGRVMRELEDL